MRELKSYRLFAVLLILLALEATALLLNYWREVDHQLDRITATRQTAVATVLESYQHIVEIFYNEYFNQAPTAALLAKAAVSDEINKVQLRDRLYRQFLTGFENLQLQGITSLQFILPNGQYFLRYEHPDVYGDLILDKRPVIKSVLEGFSQSGVLESGPIYPSYRFAFPIKQNEQVVGIVDFGVSFKTIRDTLKKVERIEHIHYRLILKEHHFESIINPDTRALFHPADISSAYLLEKPTGSKQQISELERIETYLYRNPELKQALDLEQAFAQEICINSSDCYAVNLQVVGESTQNAYGFILIYSAIEQLRSLRSLHLTVFLLGSILISITLYSFNHWLQITQRLNTISDQMAEGMYVTDTSGKLLYVNPTACKILKYTKSQLLGKNAHDLLHCNEQGNPMPQQACMIQGLNLQGENYRGDEYYFRCQDGTPIRTSIVASPIWSNGTLSGSVVLFRDITEEYKIKQRQQRSDVALSSLAEGVMVTDADANIEAVNSAFSKITGYQESEILGQKPSLLKSGHHDETFYENMWNQLILEGQWKGEIWNRRKNGQIYPELLQINSVTGEDGSVSAYVATFSDVTEKRQYETQLHQLAYTDSLTKLHNRTAFMETFGHALAHAKRRHTRCALLYLDLDRFKKINDTLGHNVGDKVLIESAQRLNQAVRNEDEVARLGGDEFIVLLENIPQDDSPARVARKIISLLGQPINLQPHVLHITASIGIAIYPDDGKDTTTLLKNADTAMYIAKREGRNDFHYFTQAMATKEENRFKLEIDLHSALRNDELLLRYQPKIDLLSGETTGFEALLYWQHPHRGLLSAGHFLGVAQDAGVMREITHWVINESCSQLLEWLDQGLDPGRLAINIDAYTFNSSDAYDQICRTIQLTGVSPSHIELEVAEDGVLEKSFDDPFWSQLVELGFTLSIDDFGTGVSSLYRLKRLPVSTLKIDLSFTQNIEHNEEDRSIIRTVVAMGKSLGLNILAEGIENHKQLRFLCEIGCDEGQGHLFSKPQSSLAIADLLTTGHYKRLVSEAAQD